MRILIVDDDFVPRSLMLKILSPYARCDVAVNVQEADTAFRLAKKEGKPYDAIFLDIMLPDGSGIDLLIKIREFETAREIPYEERCRVIMASSVDDPTEILSVFKEQCDAYVIKPVNQEKILDAAVKAELRLIKVN